MSTNQDRFNRAWQAHCRTDIDYADDCERICEIAQRKLDLELTQAQAQVVWQWHSETVCAGWLFVRDEDEVVGAIESFMASAE